MLVLFVKLGCPTHLQPCGIFSRKMFVALFSGGGDQIVAGSMIFHVLLYIPGQKFSVCFASFISLSFYSMILVSAPKIAYWLGMYTAFALPAGSHGDFVLICSDKHLRHAEGPPYMHHICRRSCSHRAIVTNPAALDDGAMTHVGL